MKTKAAALLALAALGNAWPTPLRASQQARVYSHSPSRRKAGKPSALAAPYGIAYTEQDSAICRHNETVDRKKRERHQRRIGKAKAGQQAQPEKIITPHIFTKVNGASDIRQLIPAYQHQSASLRKPLNAQHHAEFHRRKVGRSDVGMGREARQMTASRKRRNERISNRVAGNASEVAVRLVNLQHAHAQEIRQRQWAGWEPTASANIWHNEALGVYMFSDETGDLFVFNPEFLCFKTAEDAESALGYYVSHLAGRLSEDQFNEAIGELGSKFEECAADENFALPS